MLQLHKLIKKSCFSSFILQCLIIYYYLRTAHRAGSNLETKLFGIHIPIKNGDTLGVDYLQKHGNQRHWPP